MASDKKIVLVTGGNTGLGLEIIRALYQTDVPYEIFLGSRTVSKGEDAIAALRKETPQSPSSLSVVQVDVNSDESLEKAVETIGSRHGRLDVLINNAGGCLDKQVADGVLGLREMSNASWDLNVTGTHVLTTLAAPLLLKSADPRILFITSGTSSLTETDSGAFDLTHFGGSPPPGWPKASSAWPYTMYRAAKTGLNMLMREWHRVLKNDGVKVWAISPGFLATGLGGLGKERLASMGAKDPSSGGQFVRDVVQGKRDEDTGKVIRPTSVQAW